MQSGNSSRMVVAVLNNWQGLDSQTPASLIKIYAECISFKWIIVYFTLDSSLSEPMAAFELKLALQRITDKTSCQLDDGDKSQCLINCVAFCFFPVMRRLSTFRSPLKQTLLFIPRVLLCQFRKPH